MACFLNLFSKQKKTPAIDFQNFHSNEIRICIGGAVNVGKSCVSLRLTGENFAPTSSTIGVDVLQTKVKLENQEVVKIWLFDTAGQEKFGSIVPIYLRNNQGIILVYDVNDLKTLDLLSTYWVSQLIQGLNQHSFLYALILGNKSDLLKGSTTQTETSEEEAEKLQTLSGALNQLGIKAYTVTRFSALDSDSDSTKEIMVEFCKKLVRSLQKM